MKAKKEFTVRLDTQLYKKLLYVAEKENNSLNNHLLHIIRSNVQYYEKTHGKINTAAVRLPEETQEETPENEES
ncbi:MAG: hypothetical protein KHW59_06985 [Clostridiales bacterium]|nr:hypothetical protein [Clostridiales bacterium]